jgi:Cu/Ag efflux protein CusF
LIVNPENLMKTLAARIVIASIGLFPIVALSAGEHDAHAGHGAMQSPAENSFVEGVVKKIDKSAAKVTLSHGPLTNLGMPAMTMAFRVKEAAWLTRMKEGDRIRFVADSINGALTIVVFEPAK